MFEMMLTGRKVQSGGAGFIREVPASEFITGDALAAGIGLTAGVSQHSDAGWLKFRDSVDGKTKYISKKPLRHSISWNHINVVGAAFGTAQAVIKGDTYKVRLLSGANTNPAIATTGSFDHPGTHYCEWNRLLYHISAKPFANASNTLASEGIIEGDWASYSEADVGTAMMYTGGNGRLQWCQETDNTGTKRVIRGYQGVSFSYLDPSSNASVNYGWRAVLELVG